MPGQGRFHMQLRHGRESVGKACYVQFFDNVSRHIDNNELANLSSPEKLIPDSDCLSTRKAGEKPAVLDTAVPTLALKEVLSLTSGRAKPLFLDTRETWEFEEGHIPGAINMKLREINQQSAKSLLMEKTVIAYCVKDFRGYEAARKLRLLGVNAVIMTPHGMRGWIEAGLPVAGSRGKTESIAMSELVHIAKASSRSIAH